VPILNSIAAFHPEMTAWRQDLHANPELSMQESRTAGVVRAKLVEFGVDEIITGMATHGVVGVVRAGSSDRAIGLRADMDALPIHEETGLPHASRGIRRRRGQDGQGWPVRPLSDGEGLWTAQLAGGKGRYVPMEEWSDDGGGRLL
jgi:hypothetical protein